MKVLLTGGCGFIGHHTVEHIMEGTDWQLIVMDRLSYAGNQNYITDIDTYQDWKDRFSFIYHDFRSPISETTHNLIGELDYIIHMGAESHVDNSIEDPMLFAESNVIGTINMLEYLRHYQPQARFVYVSTDEVYGASVGGHLHKEGEPHRPSNPYSASKSGAEAFCYAYFKTYGLDVIITNTMNNFGERQNPEKFLPRVVKAILTDEVLTLHCKKENGKVVDISSRCWLHARDHADGLLFVLENGKAGESYNITGDWASVRDLADLVADKLNKGVKYEYEDFHSFRPGHDMHYGLDGTKMKELGWKPAMTLDETLEKTVKWMQENPRWLNYGEKVSK